MRTRSMKSTMVDTKDCSEMQSQRHNVPLHHFCGMGKQIFSNISYLKNLKHKKKKKKIKERFICSILKSCFEFYFLDWIFFTVNMLFRELNSIFELAVNFGQTLVRWPLNMDLKHYWNGETYHEKVCDYFFHKGYRKINSD